MATFCNISGQSQSVPSRVMFSQHVAAPNTQFPAAWGTTPLRLNLWGFLAFRLDGFEEAVYFDAFCLLNDVHRCISFPDNMLSF